MRLLRMGMLVAACCAMSCGRPAVLGLRGRDGGTLILDDGSAFRLGRVRLAEEGSAGQHLDEFLRAAAVAGLDRSEGPDGVHLRFVNPFGGDGLRAFDSEGDVDVEELLVVTGYARTVPGATERLVRAERIARTLRLGVWSSGEGLSPGTMPPPLRVLGLGAEFVYYDLGGVSPHAEWLLFCIDWPESMDCSSMN